MCRQARSWLSGEGDDSMPLINVHVVKGRTAAETAALLQAIHDGMVKAFDTLSATVARCSPSMSLAI